MAENFSWDKVLGQSAPDQSQTPPPKKEIDDILKEIEDRAAKAPPAAPPVAPPQAPPAVSRDAGTPQVEAPALEVVSTPSRSLIDPEVTRVPTDDEAQQTYVPAYVPKDVREVKSEANRYAQAMGQPALSVQTGTPDAKSLDMAHIDELLQAMVERKASDLHITVNLPPMARVDGEVTPLPFEMVTPEIAKRLVYEIFSDDQLKKFEQTHELDFAYSVKDMARFRVNAYMQRGSVAAALRFIPNRIPSYDELRLPPVIREMAKRSSGLVLVTGPTGSGKSTTIAAMIDDINATRSGHILTIEDPIEYLHNHKKCMVNQREMHADTYSFHSALRAVLREDPDIILVGELRDLETIEAALTLAETGHLVFGTLHTRNAPSTIDRIVDVFPADQQEQIRVLLANTIEGIVAQQLLPKLGGGRCAAMEIMIGIPAVRNLIREAKTHQMYSVIETSRQIGMQTMDSHLAELFRSGQVSYDECLLRSVDKETFARLAKSAA